MIIHYPISSNNVKNNKKSTRNSSIPILSPSPTNNHLLSLSSISLFPSKPVLIPIKNMKKGNLLSWKKTYIRVINGEFSQMRHSKRYLERETWKEKTQISHIKLIYLSPTPSWFHFWTAPMSQAGKIASALKAAARNINGKLELTTASADDMLQHLTRGTIPSWDALICCRSLYCGSYCEWNPDIPLFSAYSKIMYAFFLRMLSLEISSCFFIL